MCLMLTQEGTVRFTVFIFMERCYLLERSREAKTRILCSNLQGDGGAGCD